MSLTNEERKTLVALELRKARETYEDTGVLPIEYGHLYNQLQTMREESDYNCVYDVEPEALLSRIEPARQLIDDIELLISR